MADAYRFLLLGLIIAANGFFAGAEVSLLASRKSRLRQLAEGGDVGAQAAVSLLANPERLLSVVQVGVTLTSLGLGWAGEALLFNVLYGNLLPVIAPELENALRWAVFALSFAIMTFAHVVLGEVVPKNLAIEKADRLAVMVSPVLLVFYRISEPFVFAIERSATAISRLIGLSGEQHTGGHSAEELKYIIDTSRRELKDFQRSALTRVLDLREVYAREIMVPRTAIVSVSIDATLDQLLQLFLEHLYSRFPVYEGKRENIVGILHFKDLIRVWEQRKRATEQRRPAQPFRVRRIMRKLMIVPETKPAGDLVDEFRHNRTHMAIVVDEFGSITGLVTLEDVLEQIFGEFEDEHDEQRARPLDSLEDVLEVEGTIPIRDLESHWGIELPSDAGFETLAGFLLYQFGSIPRSGDTIDFGSRRFTILEMNRRRITRVEIRRLEAPASSGDRPGVATE